MDILIEILPARAASLLSVKSLEEDLQVSSHTISNYLTIFDNMYLTFRISPYGRDRAKSLKKQQKLFFWDWSILQDNPGARFENLVASHLLKCGNRKSYLINFHSHFFSIF